LFLAIGAIGRESGATSPAVGDLTAAAAADLRLLRGAFRAAGIDLQTGDIAFARSTLTRFEVEIGLRNGQVVEPWRRADSALVIEMERHADSGASVDTKVIDIASGKILSESRQAALRPRPPFQTAEDVEAQFRALAGSLKNLQTDRQLTSDAEGAIDRRATPRVVPTSHRDLNLMAQEEVFKELNLRASPQVEIRDLGESRRIEEELAKAGKGKGKNKNKDKSGKAGDKANQGLALGDLLVSVGGGKAQQIAPGSTVNIKA
jgi:hypothetical protein